MSRYKDIPREELSRLFVKERLSIKELAQYYGVHEYTIANIIFKARKKNPEMFPYIRDCLVRHNPDIEQIKDLYINKNKSAGQIAIRLGVETKTVNYWIRLERQKNPNSFPKKAKEYTRPSAEELSELYIVKNMTNREVSEYYNISLDKANVWLNYARQKHPELFPYKDVRFSRNPGRETLHRLYIIEDKSVNEIAEIYAVTPTTVRSWLHKAGIELKSKVEKAG